MKRVFAGAVLALVIGFPAGAATPRPHPIQLNSAFMDAHVTYRSKSVRTACPKGRHWVNGYVRKDGKNVGGYCR